MSDPQSAAEHDLTEKYLLMCVYNKGLNAAWWKQIGVCLGLPTSVLEEVECAYPRSPHDCLLKVLSSWLKSNGNASKKDFLQALE